MGAERKDVHDLLVKVGATKVRHNKHAVWELPNGRRLTVPTTPSDPQTWSKTYSRIQKLAGVAEADSLESKEKVIPEKTTPKKKLRSSGKQPKQLKIVLPEESVPPKQDLRAQLKAVLPKVKEKPKPPVVPPKPPPRQKLDPAAEFERVMLQAGVRRKKWPK